MSPSIKKLLIFLCIAAILVFVFLFLKNIKDKNFTSSLPNTNNENNNSSIGSLGEKYLDSLPNGSFPIKKGQTSKLVYLLQYSLNKNKGQNLVTDGIFGNLTLAALKSSYNVENVSQSLGVTMYLAMTKTPNIDNYILLAFKNLNLNS